MMRFNKATYHKTIISRFIHKITFLENKNTQDIDENQWIEFVTSFAEIKPICDNRFIALENEDFGNVIAAEYFQFNIRFIQHINQNMRIRFNQRIFEIKRILNENEQNKILKIIALEV